MNKETNGINRDSETSPYIYDRNLIYGRTDIADQ